MFNGGGSYDIVLRTIREGLILVLILSAPPLLASLAIGFVVGILQAATQINDQTIGFVPKLVVVVFIIIAVGPIMGAQLLRFMQSALAAMPNVK